MTKFYVIDLFAGPGGLGEGFTGYTTNKGEKPYSIAFSVEKDSAAHSTLRLRSFLRHFKRKLPKEYYRAINSGENLPDFSLLYPSEWEAAENEALNIELGVRKTQKVIDERIKNIQNIAGHNTILIGGPPCQAYSTIGRARNKGSKDYRPELDNRHFLYKEYIRILEMLSPSAFIMENVKGLISSRVGKDLIGKKILYDLENSCKKYGGYRLIPLSPELTESKKSTLPELSKFLIKAENYGVPQTRHRIFILGVREDICNQESINRMLKTNISLSIKKKVTIRQIISNLSKIRSGLSYQVDSSKLWKQAIINSMEIVKEATKYTDKKTYLIARINLKNFKTNTTTLERSRTTPSKIGRNCPEELKEWIEDANISRLPNHDTRSHMQSDLTRYVFAATFALAHGRSPSSEEFPKIIAPKHSNWTTGAFSDRFRVQISKQPGSTITSHLAKDGHYYIHPDPMQVRSFTVREAARIQTFPDNYLFLGTRTEQYTQVGNAVPPYLATQIAELLYKLLSKSSK